MPLALAFNKQPETIMKFAIIRHTLNKAAI